MGFPKLTTEPPATAKYAVSVPAEGDYTFRVRTFGLSDNGIRSPFRWRFGDGKWVEQAQGAGTTIHKVKPTSNRTLAWVRLGKARLAAGTQPFQIEMLDLKDAAGFDCFALGQGAFQPNATLNPGEKLGLAMEGWWAFEPDADAFSPDALLDLSDLNHKPAGKADYVTRSPDGNDFTYLSGCHPGALLEFGRRCHGMARGQGAGPERASNCESWRNPAAPRCTFPCTAARGDARPPRWVSSMLECPFPWEGERPREPQAQGVAHEIAAQETPTLAVQGREKRLDAATAARHAVRRASVGRSSWRRITKR
jgi:hypothetical protein